MDRNLAPSELKNVSEIVKATEIELPALESLKSSLLKEQPNFFKTHFLKRGCPRLVKMAQKAETSELDTAMSSQRNIQENRRQSFNLTEIKISPRNTFFNT